MSYRFRCPKCGNKVEALIKPIGSPTCDGRHADHDGKVLAGHLACRMDEVAASSSTPKTPKGHLTMKNPENVCQCFSEPAPGKPDTHQSCMRLTRGRFAPGHDAKLKGLLIAKVLEGTEFKFVDGDGKLQSVDPEAYAKDLGWAKYTDRAKEVAAERKANRERTEARKAEVAAVNAKSTKGKTPKAPKRAAASKVVDVKVGRWTYQGKIVADHGAKLDVEYLQGGQIIKATVAAEKVTPHQAAA